jgi:hypothetical protein
MSKITCKEAIEYVKFWYKLTPFYYKNDGEIVQLANVHIDNRSLYCIDTYSNKPVTVHTFIKKHTGKSVCWLNAVYIKPIDSVKYLTIRNYIEKYC